jgi:hypothetical protein
LLISGVLHEKFAGRQFEIVAFCLDDDLEENPGPLTYAKINSPTFEKFASVIPSTWLIDPDGKIVRQLTGLPEGELENAIEEAINSADRSVRSGGNLWNDGSTLPRRGTTLPFRGTTLPSRGTTLPTR